MLRMLRLPLSQQGLTTRREADYSTSMTAKSESDREADKRRDEALKRMGKTAPKKQKDAPKRGAGKR